MNNGTKKEKNGSEMKVSVGFICSCDFENVIRMVLKQLCYKYSTKSNLKKTEAKGIRLFGEANNTILYV